LLDYARDVSETRHGKSGSGLAHLVRRLARLARRLRRAAHGFDDLPFAQRHELRKRLKRLRYLAGFAAPAFGHESVGAWIDKVSAAQDRLGKHIDLALAADRFAVAATTDPDAGYAAGWLRAKAESSARAARKSLERLGRAERFW
jgi:CHAD domain-containing protein